MLAVMRADQGTIGELRIKKRCFEKALILQGYLVFPPPHPPPPPLYPVSPNALSPPPALGTIRVGVMREVHMVDSLLPTVLWIRDILVKIRVE